MSDRGEEKTIQQIKESLDILDNCVKVNVPDFAQFTQLVAQVEDKKRHRMNMQFSLFLILAVILLTFEFYAFYNSFIIFTTVQIAALAFLPVGLFMWSRHQRKQVNNL